MTPSAAQCGSKPYHCIAFSVSLLLLGVCIVLSVVSSQSSERKMYSLVQTACDEDKHGLTTSLVRRATVLRSVANVIAHAWSSGVPRTALRSWAARTLRDTTDLNLALHVLHRDRYNFERGELLAAARGLAIP